MGRLTADNNWMLSSCMCCAQDEVPGLQVKLASGEWVVAPPVPGVLSLSQSAQQPRIENGWHQVLVQWQLVLTCSCVCIA
jgi:hypothetical protein